MIDYKPLIRRWLGGELDRRALSLPGQIAAGLSQQRYGELPRGLK